MKNLKRPTWLTFDCYGTLIQWDEGLLAAAETILARHGDARTDPTTLIATYDRHEHALERERPHRLFRDVAGEGLRRAMSELGLAFDPADLDTLISSIPAMPPFPEVPAALAEMKQMGFKLCIISNADDDLIAGNVARLGGAIDRVVTAEQAKAYKPSRQIFDHAHRAIGAAHDDLVHICASPHLDLVAARDFGFRAIWVDRGTGRKRPPDYEPDAVFPTLDRVAEFLETRQWEG